MDTKLHTHTHTHTHTHARTPDWSLYSSHSSASKQTGRTDASPPADRPILRAGNVYTVLSPSEASSRAGRDADREESNAERQCSSSHEQQLITASDKTMRKWLLLSLWLLLEILFFSFYFKHIFSHELIWESKISFVAEVFCLIFAAEEKCWCTSHSFHFTSTKHCCDCFSSITDFPSSFHSLAVWTQYQ